MHRECDTLWSYCLPHVRMPFKQPPHLLPSSDGRAPTCSWISNAFVVSSSAPMTCDKASMLCRQTEDRATYRVAGSCEAAPHDSGQFCTSGAWVSESSVS